MAKFTFENLTPEQAKTLSEWFEENGEQEAFVWFEENFITPVSIDVERTGGYRDILPNGDIICYCKSN